MKKDKNDFIYEELKKDIYNYFEDDFFRQQIKEYEYYSNKELNFYELEKRGIF